MSLALQSDKEQAKIQSLAFLLSICICSAVSVCLVLLYSTALADSQRLVLDDKLNPNVETAVSMARLPSFGQAKAKAVAEYRQSGGVFERADDLDKIKGIGPKTVENIRPYLRFE
jgi:competence ComEA-like helix-hairpin-helix protein